MMLKIGFIAAICSFSSTQAHHLDRNYEESTTYYKLRPINETVVKAHGPTSDSDLTINVSGFFDSHQEKDGRNTYITLEFFDDAKFNGNPVIELTVNFTGKEVIIKENGNVQKINIIVDQCAEFFVIAGPMESPALNATALTGSVKIPDREMQWFHHRMSRSVGLSLTNIRFFKSKGISVRRTECILLVHSTAGCQLIVQAPPASGGIDY